MAEARAVSVTRSVEGGRVRGYVEAEDEERIQNRLRRIEGQVRGVQRMVDEEAYCVDVLTQISGAVSALEKVGALAQGPRRALRPGVCRGLGEGGREDRGTHRRSRRVPAGLERRNG
jgi:Metal-sensitive transcriptional repressor